MFFVLVSRASDSAVAGYLVVPFSASVWRWCLSNASKISKSRCSSDWRTELSAQSDNLLARYGVELIDLIHSHSQDLSNEILLTCSCCLLRWRWWCESRLLDWWCRLLVVLGRVSWVAGLWSRSVGALRRLRHRWWRYWCPGCELWVLGSGGLDNAAEHARVDKAEKEKGLENGVGELGSLAQEFSCLIGIRHDETLHLRDNIKQLRSWDGAQCL